MKTKRKYDYASHIYDFSEILIEKLLFSRLRKKAIALAEGLILEVGIGTGKNIKYYRNNVEVIGIDFSRGMLKKAMREKDKLQTSNVSLVEMDAQNMAFKTEIFDTIVTSFVLCTVPDPLLGLKNIYKVLKPGGKAIFVEHMKTDNLFINILLNIMNIFSSLLLGTSMIRETQKNIAKANFKILSVEKYHSGVVRLIIAQKEE